MQSTYGYALYLYVWLYPLEYNTKNIVEELKRSGLCLMKSNMRYIQCRYNTGKDYSFDNTGVML